MGTKGPSISHDSLWSSGETVTMADLEELSEESVSPAPNLVQKTEKSNPENKQKRRKVCFILLERFQAFSSSARCQIIIPMKSHPKFRKLKVEKISTYRQWRKSF